MIRQLLLALSLTAITVTVHAIGTANCVVPMSGIWSNRDERKARSGVVPLIRLVGGLLVLHLIEMSMWAGAFSLFGVLPDFETSLYFSLTSYTTVGYGDVLPPESWRLIGPIEAAIGVLMLGWSTGFIVAAVQRTFGNRTGPPSGV